MNGEIKVGDIVKYKWVKDVSDTFEVIAVVIIDGLKYITLKEFGGEWLASGYILVSRSASADPYSLDAVDS